jgi:hypothetical protein
VSTETVQQLADHGVHRMVIGFPGGDPAQLHDQMSEFAERFKL